MNGQIRIPLTTRQYFVVAGGPYRQRPEGYAGVKMAKEISAECAVDIPTHDFQVPDKKLLYMGLLKAVNLMLAGEPLYVGCMGGVGRTGLFMAILAKAFGVKNPVKFVRAHYMPHAVETPQQQEFVKKFIVQPQVHIAIKRYRRKMWWRFWRTNLTRQVQSVAEQKNESSMDAEVRGYLDF